MAQTEFDARDWRDVARDAEAECDNLDRRYADAKDQIARLTQQRDILRAAARETIKAAEGIRVLLPVRGGNAEINQFAHRLGKLEAVLDAMDESV